MQKTIKDRTFYLSITIMVAMVFVNTFMIYKNFMLKLAEYSL